MVRRQVGIVDLVTCRRAQVAIAGLSGNEHDTLLGGSWTA
jgi:hypothetical protein